MFKYLSALMTLVIAQGDGGGDGGGRDNDRGGRGGNDRAPEIWTTEAAMNSYITNDDDLSLMARVDKEGSSDNYGGKMEIDEWDAEN